MFTPSPRVLVIDDEPQVRSFLVDALNEDTSFLELASDMENGVSAISRDNFDVVLCDVHMPGMPGTELLKLAAKSSWDLSIILMTGRPELPDMLSSIRFGAADFLLKPFSIQDVSSAVKNSYQRLCLKRQERAHSELLDDVVRRRTRDLEIALCQLDEAYKTSLEALVAALDARERETCAHSMRVKSYASHLARLADYPSAQLAVLQRASLLHDIGKIAVPDAILLKPAKLTILEFEEMKRHTVIGSRIVEPIEFLRATAPIIRHHHERFDGGGYPDGLAGECIPLGARIFAVADSYDAITSDRCYRRALPYEVACNEILRCSGTQFDPCIVELFCSVPESVWKDIRAEAEYQSVSDPFQRIIN
jgi:putative two-component system response regulator